MRPLIAILIGFISCTALASAPIPASNDPVTATINKLSPDATIESITQGPIPGLVTAVVDGRSLYISDDGRYVMQGHLYDMERGLDLSERQVAADRAKLLNRLNPLDLIAFAPAHPRYRVIAFVDPTCGYCRQLVSNLDGYLKDGIEVDFAAWPRAGTASTSPGYQLAINVWCAADRRLALQDIFRGKEVPARQCRNPVEQQARMAVSLELPGTPGLLAPDGTLLGGYVDPAQLRLKLDRLASQLADDGAQVR